MTKEEKILLLREFLIIQLIVIMFAAVYLKLDTLGKDCSLSVTW